MILRFEPKQASGLSQASIFGACLGGLILNAQDKHPNHHIRSDPGVLGANHLQKVRRRKVQKEFDDDFDESDNIVCSAEDKANAYLENGGKYYTRPIIHYDMVTFLAPMNMAGAVLGVMVQRILPNWLYLLLSGLVLSFIAYNTIRKYRTARQKENELKKKEQLRQLQPRRTASQLEDEETKHDDATNAKVTSALAGSTSSQEFIKTYDTFTHEVESEEETPLKKMDLMLQQQCEMTIVTKMVEAEELTIAEEKKKMRLRIQYLEEDMVQYPKDKILALVILWLGLFILTLLKGGSGIESFIGITCESPWYYVLVASDFVWILGFALYFGHRLLQEQANRVAVDYPFLEQDPIWDRPGLQLYGGVTFIAGFFSGMVGFGVGMILGPFMLFMGSEPRVASATNASMIMPTSSIIAIGFVVSGYVPWSYAVFYFSVCFLGALFGKSKIDAYVKRTGRPSILIVILAIIIALSTVGIFYSFFTRLAAKGWCLDGFNDFCTVTDKDVCLEAP
jgi:uncharacterized membrane protein YfcA